MDPKTVRKIARRRPRKMRDPVPSLLDPFRPVIKELVLKKALTAIRVLEEIRALEYEGGYTILKEYIRTFRPKPIRTPHERFETDPGVQGQVDLSPYKVLLGDVLTDVVCFSFVLGFSRWQFIRFVLHAEVRAVCHSHVLAFEEAGGVPHEILYDRMKQIVLHSEVDGVLFHPLFEQVMQYYGFRAVPLAPGYKEGKGKVENPFGYVEGNFLAGRTFQDLDDLNRQAARWLAEIARVRVHRTTQEQPIARLGQERPHLIALPEKPFDAAIVRQRVVGDDYCVPWETNRYSVSPTYTGQTAVARVLEGRLEVLVHGDVVTSHLLRSTKHKRYVHPEHEEEFRLRSKSRVVLEEQFLRLGESAKDFANGLADEKGGSAGYHMSQILRLVERGGAERVSEALRHAVRYGAFSHRAVERIVTGKAPARRTPRDSRTIAAMTPSQIDKYLKGAGSHQRSLKQYRARKEDRPPDENDQGEDDDGE